MGSDLQSINFEFRNDDNKRSRMNYYLFYTVSYPLKYCFQTGLFPKWYISRKITTVNCKQWLYCFALLFFVLFIQLFMQLFIQRNHAVWIHRFHITFTTFTLVIRFDSYGMSHTACHTVCRMPIKTYLHTIGFWLKVLNARNF